MSLIEDAARRLEELRRAGVSLPDDAREAPRLTKPNGETPLPEAVVAAMESKRAESGLLHGHAVQADRAAGVSDRPSARTPVRQIALNLEKLRSLGFVTPDVPT